MFDGRGSLSTCSKTWLEKTTLNTNQDIPKLAEIAAKECKGLPLAIGDHWASYDRQEHSTRMGASYTNIEDFSIKASRYGGSCIPDHLHQLFLEFNLNILAFTSILCCLGLRMKSSFFSIHRSIFVFKLDDELMMELICHVVFVEQLLALESAQTHRDRWITG